MTVRSATPADVPLVRAIQTLLDEPVTDLFADGLPAGFTFVVVPEPSSTEIEPSWTGTEPRTASGTRHPVGYVHAYESGYVTELAVAPAHRGRGHGRALMSRVVAAVRAAGAEHVELDVACDNETARGFYESIGFVVVDHLEDRYESGDGVGMRLDL